MTEPTPPAAPTPASPAPAPTPPAARPQRSLRRPPPRRDEPEPSLPPVLDRQELNLEPPKLRELDAAIESELEAALAGFSADDLSAEPAKAKRKDPAAPKEPQRGKVIAIHHADVFVEVPGGKSQGVLSLTQFPDEPPKIGDIVEFSVERYDPSNGLLVLTRQGAAVAADWSSVHIGQIVEARVTGTNKGGLAVEVNGIRAFPAHQPDRSLPSRKCRAVRQSAAAVHGGRGLSGREESRLEPACAARERARRESREALGGTQRRSSSQRRRARHQTVRRLRRSRRRGWVDSGQRNELGAGQRSERSACNSARPSKCSSLDWIASTGKSA